ncbi:MAG: hybrid sensor histidine kinase/response regulator [Magnetococcales bacterium]|nr:hybrid sensor histidine kinase/response regulator [Magnetococcales bacterium]
MIPYQEEHLLHQRPTVLLIDDQPEHIDVIKHALEAQFTVKIATHGALGLRLASQGVIDLILLDIMMPDMDGYEVCRRLKADPATRDIPVVFLTAKQDFYDETEGLRLGAADFIRKPSNPAVVLTRICNLVELYRARQMLLTRNEELLYALRIREDMERLSHHDLKGPLAGILGLPELLLEDDNLTDEQREIIKVIHTNGYTLLEMINRSLDLYKMENGSYVLHPEQFDLRLLLNKIIQDLETHWRVKRIHVALQGGAEGFFVLGEKWLCYSLFHNVLLNAIQASGEEESVTVALSTESGRQLITLTNAGEVPVGIRERFFEKYTTFGKDGGTGLGTYSAWLAAHTQAGSIAVACDRPGFTSVTVALPAPSGENREPPIGKPTP